jgi:hypothetical protein
VRIVAVNPDNASGSVIWRDETAPALKAGDVVGIAMGGAPAVIEVAPGVPAAPQRFETGASDIGVPTADHSYLYLASLAAAGLITSQPAHVFNDNGSFHHDTAEDITFSRAQIAGLINEALNSPKAAKPSEKVRVALSNLIQEYDRDLRRIGVSDAALTPFTENKGFAFGISGQQRVTLTGGDDDAGFLVPFSQRAGGLRTRSGFDTRTNLWAKAGDFSFLGTMDGGTDPIRGVDSRNYLVRRALLSYNANKLLRGLTISAGRDELWLGPGHFGTLALSDNAGPLNLLKAKFQRGSYVAESVYAPLGSGPGGGDRSLYVKNTYLNIGSQSRIGIVETVLHPTETLKPALFLSTFSPIPLALAQRIGDDDSNLTGAVYGETAIARGARIYGELLVDDLAANDNNRTRNRYGSLLGAHLFNPKNPTKLGLYAEFVNLQGRTYLNLGANPDYNYYYRGVPLGYPVAPPFNNFGAGRGIGGAESLRMEAYWRPIRKLRLSGGFEYADLNSEVDVTPPNFPAPGFSLSRQQIFRVRASYDLTRSLTLTARAMKVDTTQPNFIAGEPKVSDKLFSLEIARAY